MMCCFPFRAKIFDEGKLDGSGITMASGDYIARQAIEASSEDIVIQMQSVHHEKVCIGLLATPYNRIGGVEDMSTATSDANTCNAYI